MASYNIEHKVPDLIRDYLKSQFETIAKQETKKASELANIEIEKRIMEVISRVHVEPILSRFGDHIEISVNFNVKE